MNPPQFSMDAFEAEFESCLRSPKQDDVDGNSFRAYSFATWASSKQGLTDSDHLAQELTQRASEFLWRQVRLGLLRPLRVQGTNAAEGNTSARTHPGSSTSIQCAWMVKPSRL